MAPAAIAGVTLAVTAIGAGVTAYSAMQQGAATNAQMQYQSRVADINRQFNLQEADYALRAGEVKAQGVGLRGRSVIAASRAAFGASGVEGGSQEKVLSSEEELGQHDEAVIRADSARTAFGYRVAAAGDVAQGQLDISAGTQAERAGALGEYASVLGGVTSVGDKWTKYAQTVPGFPGGTQG